MNGAQTEQVVEPRTTGELFRYIGKKLPKQILKALPVTIAVAVVSWLVHTYLIVGPNGGFAPDTWLANNILNVKGKLKRQGRTAGYRPDWKKAIVTLKDGQRLPIFEE